MDELLQEIRNRQKQAEFNSGILTADRYVKSVAECVGTDLCSRYDCLHGPAFNAMLKSRASTLTYNNEDMVVTDMYGKSYDWKDADGDDLELPKNTLMVFRNVLTTPRKDRDGDVLRTSGAKVDPKMLLLWQHLPTMPIGRMLKVHEHNSKRLEVISAIIDINPLCHDSAVMVENGMGRFSHGFRAFEFTRIKAPNGKNTGFDITAFEVMEESLVSIPSNVDSETLEIMVSLVESKKLTSPIMKSYGKSLRDSMDVTITPGIDLKSLEEHEEEHGPKTEKKAGCTGDSTSCSCGCGGKVTASKEADDVAGEKEREIDSDDKKMICPECGAEMEDGICVQCRYSSEDSKAISAYASILQGVESHVKSASAVPVKSVNLVYVKSDYALVMVERERSTKFFRIPVDFSNDTEKKYGTPIEVRVNIPPDVSATFDGIRHKAVDDMGKSFIVSANPTQREKMLNALIVMKKMR